MSGLIYISRNLLRRECLRQHVIREQHQRQRHTTADHRDGQADRRQRGLWIMAPPSAVAWTLSQTTAELPAPRQLLAVTTAALAPSCLFFPAFYSRTWRSIYKSHTGTSHDAWEALLVTFPLQESVPVCARVCENETASECLWEDQYVSKSEGRGKHSTTTVIVVKGHKSLDIRLLWRVDVPTTKHNT